MPLYEFKCLSCKREFEDLSTADDKDNPRPCPSCGKQEIVRKVSSFSTSSTIIPGRDTVYSTKEIDKVVGAASAKNWEGWNKYYENKKKKRREGKDIKEVVVDKGAPFEHLGSPKEQEFRKNYTKEYKTQITDKGKDGDKTPVVMKVDKFA